jgi:hypothetical protein
MTGGGLAVMNLPVGADVDAVELRSAKVLGNNGQNSAPASK